ncbi:hypothetical protein M3699_17690 [Peribacillus simplex]|uniref:hypothetical protein n=1 Tax=Peribacillus simplex TaxID=1478 RepID=UPI00203CE3D8|nr:hypothetical protein [Peribacillus simplex]MCM3675649.1 hypothetical protein [Peribacillus simplex]
MAFAIAIYSNDKSKEHIIIMFSFFVTSSTSLPNIKEAEDQLFIIIIIKIGPIGISFPVNTALCQRSILPANILKIMSARPIGDNFGINPMDRPP